MHKTAFHKLPGYCRAEAVDCRGGAAWNGMLEGGRVEAVPVPPAGLLRLRKL